LQVSNHTAMKLGASGVKIGFEVTKWDLHLSFEIDWLDGELGRHFWHAQQMRTAPQFKIVQGRG